MNLRIMKVLIFLTCILIAGMTGIVCAKDPPQEVLNLPFIRTSGLLKYDPVLKDLVSEIAIFANGKWEQVSSHSWIYRRKSIDKLTKEERSDVLLIELAPVSKQPLLQSQKYDTSYYAKVSSYIVTQGNSRREYSPEEINNLLHEAWRVLYHFHKDSDEQAKKKK